MEILSQLPSSLIALVGTLVAVLIGFYQWRKQRNEPTRAAGAEARRKAYEGLWQKLEEINIKLRDTEDRNPELYRMIKDINTYFLQNSIYFDDKDQAPLNEYVAALDRLRTAIFTHGDEDVTHAWTRTVINLASVSGEIEEASETVNRLRAVVKEKIQRVVSAV